MLMSDTIELPDILPYPEILPFSEVRELHDRFVYVIERYPEDGVTIVARRDSGYINLRFGDFKGNIIDPTTAKEKQGDLIGKLGDGIIHKLSSFMKIIGLKQCAFYISDDNGTPRLVDMRISINKFAGPGYIRDFFGNIMEVQKVHKIVQLNPEVLGYLINGEYSYAGEYIVKSTAFKFITRAGTSPTEPNVLPMYGKVTRDEIEHVI